MNRNRLEEASCWSFDYDDHVKMIIDIDSISNRSDQISIHTINCFLNYFAHIDKHSDIENVDVRRWNQATSLNQSHRTILIICTRNIDHWTLLIHHTKNGWLSLDFVSLCGWLVGNKPLRGIPWKLASELAFSTAENLFKYLWWFGENRTRENIRKSWKEIWIVRSKVPCHSVDHLKQI